jgi:hypothetical protein
MDSIFVYNNHLYYKARVTLSNPQGCFGYGSPYWQNAIRIDSLSGNIVLNFTNTGCGTHEITIDSLKAKYRDTLKNFCFSENWACQDTSNYQIFSSNYPSKRFNYINFELFGVRTYVKNIGLVYNMKGQGNMYCEQTLRGCVLDGILYGDTSMVVGINEISGNIPETFSLSQNYPNPFNPVTNIKFDIPKSGMVRITIFDLLGREVTTLVNEQMQPGSYNVDWDASNYPSGVYFFKLETENFTESKKMILIK